MDLSDRRFWAALDELVAASEIVIDRPKGTPHPRDPDLSYPMDYGYLAGTTGGDGAGIDLWVGSLPERALVAIVATVDTRKRDAEVKLLLGCAPDEAERIRAMHNQGHQSAVLVPRPTA